jgi:hypothetical protein
VAQGISNQAIVCTKHIIKNSENQLFGVTKTGHNNFTNCLLERSFAKKIMENTNKQKSIWWLVFFASTAALGWAIFSHWEWLTLILPFQTTAFVKAMDIM